MHIYTYAARNSGFAVGECVVAVALSHLKTTPHREPRRPATFPSHMELGVHSFSQADHIWGQDGCWDRVAMGHLRDVNSHGYRVWAHNHGDPKVPHWRLIIHPKTCVPNCRCGRIQHLNFKPFLVKSFMIRR